MKTSLVQDLMRRFEGYNHAYGTYSSETANPNKNGKLEIRASARTVKSNVTLDLWADHVAGKSPIGIIPINEHNLCKWAVIDVDSYSINHSELVEKIEKQGVPLIVCKSKSGGAHLFAFFDDWVPAREAQQVMRGLSAALGLGNAEIFPKQSEVLLERGDFGTWLNMPYYDEGRTGRAAVKITGALMSLSEFLNVAQEKQSPLTSFKISITKSSNRNPEFTDGPPCLEHLTKLGFPEGTRNSGLMALAIFAKKKYEVNWKEKVEEYNRAFMEPPLSADEVKAVTRSVEKKDYRYSCKTQPLCNHCNSQVCIGRRFGVGEEGDFPVITGLTVMNTDPPLWFMDVGDRRLELSTDELITYNKFQKVCVERLLKVYPPLKQNTWQIMVKEAMEAVIAIEAPPEVSLDGIMKQLLEEFCADRSQTHNRDEILIGRVWESEEDKRFYFRLKDVMDYFQRSKFDDFTRPQVTSRLKKLGGDAHFFNLKGKGVNVWYLPNDFVKTPSVDLPPLKDHAI